MITDMCSLPGKWPKAEFLVMGLKLTSISELRTEGREVTMKRRKWAPEIGSVIIATFSQLRSPQGRSWDPVLQTSQLSSRRLNNVPRVAGGERSLNMNPAVLYFESAPFISLLVRVWNVSVQFSSVQSLSHVRLFATPWIAARQASLSITNSWSLHHRVGDAIQPSHPLPSPSPAPNPSQHQGLFQWVRSLHQVAKVLQFQLQHQSFQWISRTDLL